MDSSSASNRRLAALPRPVVPLRVLLEPFMFVVDDATSWRFGMSWFQVWPRTSNLGPFHRGASSSWKNPMLPPAFLVAIVAGAACRSRTLRYLVHIVKVSDPAVPSNVSTPPPPPSPLGPHDSSSSLFQGSVEGSFDWASSARRWTGDAPGSWDSPSQNGPATDRRSVPDGPPEVAVMASLRSTVVC